MDVAPLPFLSSSTRVSSNSSSRRSIQTPARTVAVRAHNRYMTRPKIEDTKQLRHIDVFGRQSAAKRVVGVGDDLDGCATQVCVQISGREVQSPSGLERDPIEQQRDQHTRVFRIPTPQVEGGLRLGCEPCHSVRRQPELLRRSQNRFRCTDSPYVAECTGTIETRQRRARHSTAPPGVLSLRVVPDTVFRNACPRLCRTSRRATIVAGKCSSVRGDTGSGAGRSAPDLQECVRVSSLRSGEPEQRRRRRAWEFLCEHHYNDHDDLLLGNAARESGGKHVPGHVSRGGLEQPLRCETFAQRRGNPVRVLRGHMHLVEFDGGRSNECGTVSADAEPIP
ncbi:hypothetical protein MLGJGCBP_03062 [Rhodococcus sp. T7]|nr:hypothetical protein MLGJGCBP_03062 [Rhodococcus sp. T7]